MPRKLRQLKSDLRKAGFFEDSKRGKGSHSFWIHPDSPEADVVLSGQDGDDVRDYQERQVREAIARATTAQEHR